MPETMVCGSRRKKERVKGRIAKEGLLLSATEMIGNPRLPSESLITAKRRITTVNIFILCCPHHCSNWTVPIGMLITSIKKFFRYVYDVIDI